MLVNINGIEQEVDEEMFKHFAKEAQKFIIKLEELRRKGRVYHLCGKCHEAQEIFSELGRLEDEFYNLLKSAENLFSIKRNVLMDFCESLVHGKVEEIVAKGNLFQSLKEILRTSSPLDCITGGNSS